MNRELLASCGPGLVALCGCGLLLFALLHFASAKADWSRLWRLHRCESGGVQSLAFVLTFPVLLAVLMVVVQISQLMVAQMFVQYAAFAGARSASVWIAAETDTEVANQIADSPLPYGDDGMYVVLPPAGSMMPIQSFKLKKIRAAVIQACAPLAPSRDLGVPRTQLSEDLAEVTQQILSRLAPSTQSNPRFADRIANKLAYCDYNTEVRIVWQDAIGPNGGNSTGGPSYNPRNHDDSSIRFIPEEAGWQDPVTVHVYHQFALLPGPGRLLAKRIVRADGLPDRVSGRINTNTRDYSETVYTTQIHASATMTIEGIKSIRPFIQEE